MRSRRVRWFAVIGVMACGLFAALPLASATAHGAKKPAHPTGFFVSGQGAVVKGTNAAAFVRDHNGGEHVVSSVASPSAPGDQGHIVYRTRRPGATKWVSRAIPGLRPMAGGIRVELHLSYNGSRVFAVIDECDGVFVTDTSLLSQRLPEPTLVEPLADCTDPPAARPGLSQTAFSVPGSPDQIGVMLPDPDATNATTIFFGSPGGSFNSSGALPTDDDFTPVQLAFDPRSEKMTVVGYGSDGTNEGVYVTTSDYYYYDYTNWSTPTLIASLGQPSADYTIESIAAYNDAIWVGLLKPATTGVTRKHALFVQHWSSSNQWIGTIPLAHTTGHDTGLRLSFNPASGHLHAAYTRVIKSSKSVKSGIFMQTRVNGAWTGVTHLTHWYRDRAMEFGYTSAGRAVIGYERG
ncbi:MAG TPA: hypothetical protein VME70_12185 [Mycobacteriales bacterium]|nr:hypothetical protein [Mycobacteriales bacterium]